MRVHGVVLLLVVGCRTAEQAQSVVSTPTPPTPAPVAEPARSEAAPPAEERTENAPEPESLVDAGREVPCRETIVTGSSDTVHDYTYDEDDRIVRLTTTTSKGRFSDSWLASWDEDRLVRLEEVDGLDAVHEFSYDARGALKTVTTDGKVVIRVRYKSKRYGKIARPSGWTPRPTRLPVNQRSFVPAVILPQFMPYSGEVEYHWDWDGNGKLTKNSNERRIEIAYLDGRKVAAQYTWPSGGTDFELWAYDESGRLTLHRFLSRSNTTISELYDWKDDVPTGVVHRRGPRWDETFEYDDRGRLVQRVRTPRSDKDDTTTWSYEYACAR